MMMQKKSIRTALTILTAALLSTAVLAEEAPVKALMITGGCCHDYDNQRDILPAAVEANSKVKVEWTILHLRNKSPHGIIEMYKNPNWAQGYDVVVHNECYAAVGDETYIAGILQPHIDGVPAVLVHCSMHCYRKEAWFEFCGVHSKRHGPHHAFEVQIVDTEHEITRGLSNWTTPKGELYYIEKVYPGVIPLAQSKSNQTGDMNMNIWAHEYGPNKTRVFATTIGHHNETMQDPAFQKMFTRGLLWAVGKSVDDSVK